MATKNPLTDVQEIAQRILDDAEKLLDEITASAAKVLNEGTALAHDTVQVPLDTIAQAHNQLGLVANKIRDLRRAAPAVPPAEDTSAPPVPAPAPVAPVGGPGGLGV